MQTLFQTRPTLTSLIQLRATLPVSIFISPNIPFDEHGSLLNQTPGESSAALRQTAVAPPGYGEHVLDQLYDDMDISGFQTPGIQSGISSPFYSQSRSGSAENLAAITHPAPFAPAALSSRLADVSLDPSQRNDSYNSLHSATGHISPNSQALSGARSEPASANLTRSNSEEDGSPRHSGDHIHLDTEEFAELNRVPSYATAVRAPLRNRTQPLGGFVPDYQTALSAPRTPPATDLHHEILAPISENGREDGSQESRHTRLTLIRSHSADAVPSHARTQRNQAV